MTFSEHLIMLPVRLASTCSSTDTVIVTLRSKIRVVLISGTGSGLPHVVLTQLIETVSVKLLSGRFMWSMSMSLSMLKCVKVIIQMMVRSAGGYSNYRVTTSTCLSQRRGSNQLDKGWLKIILGLKEAMLRSIFQERKLLNFRP